MKLKEIAAEANVSPATVSLVLNGKEGVGEEKRRLISCLLEKHGYHVSPWVGTKEEFAASKGKLLFIKYRRHGMLVDGNPGFINSIVDALETECVRQQYLLQISSCSYDQLSTLSEMVAAAEASGVLFLGTELTDEDAQHLSAITVPMVVLDTCLHKGNFSCVTMNNCEAVFSSVRHLVSLGHRKIGFIANLYPSNNCRERENAFRVAVERAGLPLNCGWIYAVQPTSDGAYCSVCELLDHGTVFPDAFVINNDSIALGVMKALKERGLQIPRDISVVGFDGISYAAYSDPPLTTVEVPCAEMGIWAVRILCDRIQYPFSAAVKVMVSTHLVVRESTAPGNY